MSFIKQTVCIYTLRDPDTGEVRYVGQTVNPSRRYHEHLQSKDAGKNPRKAEWIKDLMSKGLRPIFEIETVVDGDDWENEERSIIQFYRQSGHDLTNIQDGGNAY